MSLKPSKLLIILLICFFIFYPCNFTIAHAISALSNNEDEGVIRIASYPEEASIYVDGEFIGTTPKVIALAVGEYHIRIVMQESPLYYEETVEIEENEILEMDVDFCEIAFYRAVEKNSIESLREFIEEFAYCEEVENAKELMCSLAFKEAEREGTIESYERYIDEFPYCYNQIDIAQYRIKALREGKDIETIREEEEDQRFRWEVYEESKSKANKVTYSGLAIIAGAIGLALLADEPEYYDYKDDILTTAKITFWVGTGVTIAGLLWRLTISKPAENSDFIIKMEQSPFSKDFHICKFQNKNIRVYLGYKKSF